MSDNEFTLEKYRPGNLLICIQDFDFRFENISPRCCRFVKNDYIIVLEASDVEKYSANLKQIKNLFVCRVLELAELTFLIFIASTFTQKKERHKWVHGTQLVTYHSFQ